MMLDSQSPYLEAILPWRDSNYGQQLLTKLAKKYDIAPKTKRDDLEDRYKDIVLNGDGEKIRVSL